MITCRDCCNFDEIFTGEFECEIFLDDFNIFDAPTCPEFCELQDENNWFHDVDMESRG